MSNKKAWKMLKNRLLSVWLPVAVIVLATVLISK